MRPDELTQLLRRRPFQPFRLHMSTGDVFEVRHPEMVLMWRSVAWVEVPAEGPPVPLAQRRVIVVLIHIVYVDFIEPTVSPSNN